MPLVSEKWKSYGLKGWKVVQFGGGADGGKPEYSVQASLIWDVRFLEEEHNMVLRFRKSIPCGSSPSQRRS